MKTILWCYECYNLHNDNEIKKVNLSIVPFSDDGIIEFECTKGHKNSILLENQKFALLFEVGVFAIADSYYREAVSSFTSALERFYEYYIRLIIEKFKVSDDVFEKGWKQMRNQSERQLGAFIFAYIIQNNEMPPMLKQKDIEFRNNVIHKGEIPTKDRAIEYGNSVLNIINPMLERIHQDLSIPAALVRSKNIVNFEEAIKLKKVESIIEIKSIIAETYFEGREFPISIEDHLESISLVVRLQSQIKYNPNNFDNPK